MNELRQILLEDSRIGYAVVFGSSARGTANEGSDLDIAIGLEPHVNLGALELGELIARLEGAGGRPVDIVIVNEAPPAVAYRVFRDGQVIVEKNHRTFVEHKARAILAYLDFQPMEALTARGVLAAAAHGR